MNTADLAFFPVQHSSLHDLYDCMLRTFWTPHEIDYREDRKDWNSLDENTKNYVKKLLFLFAQLDAYINQNLLGFFVQETSKWKDASHFYSLQGANETIHNQTYSVLIETFITDIVEKMKGLDAVKYFPDIRAIADWVTKWMDTKIPLLERVIAFACIEGIIFSSAFAGIHYLRRRNILKGLLTANEWISRDEALHTKFAVELFKMIKTHHSDEYPLPSEERVHEIVRSSVEVCENFTRNSMNVDLVGLNADDMMGYVKTTADWLITSFGYVSFYNVENPLDWMATFSLQSKANMFENKVTNYARAALTIEDDNTANEDINYDSVDF